MSGKVEQGGLGFGPGDEIDPEALATAQEVTDRALKLVGPLDPQKARTWLRLMQGVLNADPITSKDQTTGEERTDWFPGMPDELRQALKQASREMLDEMGHQEPK